MATVHYELERGKKLTAKEREEIRRAAKLPYIPDEDAPELSQEQIAEFQRIIRERKELKQKQTVSLRLSNGTLAVAKTLGKSYTTILATVLENVFKDPETLKKYL